MIAICVVYLVDEAMDGLFFRHLAQLERCSGGVPFTVYAAAPRLASKYRDHLRSRSYVRLCDVEPTGLRGSAEHAYYLDQLVNRAVQAGSEYIATLDVDSFPVATSWLESCVAELQQGVSMVAVLRRENGDTSAPHPSFMFFARELWELEDLTFAPLPLTSRTRAYYKATGQHRFDTGAAFGLLAYERHLRWKALLRTNIWNPHHIMAGIYGDRVFHYGAGSRPKLFWADLARATRTTEGT
jgi:hypothetical protein